MFSQLPDIEALRRLCQSLAMLDAILSPQWEHRYFSFNAHWSENSMLFSLRNGAGDELFIGFNSAGAIVKGFDHESPMSSFANEELGVWPGVLDDVPLEFNEFLNDPAFEREATTFCLWRTLSDTSWQRGEIEFPDGDDPDGSGFLLLMFDAKAQTYRDWAKDYYEQAIDLEAVAHIYAHKPLANEIVQRLNPNLNLEEIEEDRREIGFP